MNEHMMNMWNEVEEKGWYENELTEEVLVDIGEDVTAIKRKLEE